MKSFIIFLLIASTAIAAPKKQPPKPVETITREDIQKTLIHIQELSREQAKELDAAKLTIDGQKTDLDIAAVNLDSAKAETAKVQHTIDSQRQQIADDAAKIARYHRLLRIVCTILASVAAYLAYEMLRPLGTIAKLFPVAKFAEFYIPAIAWVAVFGFCWWRF